MECNDSLVLLFAAVFVHDDDDAVAALLIDDTWIYTRVHHLIIIMMILYGLVLVEIVDIPAAAFYLYSSYSSLDFSFY